MFNKKFLLAIASLSIIASIFMYIVGKDSSHLSELKDFWWAPLPLAVVCFLAAGRKK